MRGCDGVRGGRVVGGLSGGGGGGLDVDGADAAVVVVVAGATVVVVVSVVVVVVAGGSEASPACWGEFVPAEVGGSASDGCDEIAAGTLVACVTRMAAVRMKGKMADAARPQVRRDRNRAEAPCSSGRGDAGVRGSPQGYPLYGGCRT